MGEPLPSWLMRNASGWSLRVHVQPGASRTEVRGTHGDALKVRVAAPPVEGRANSALEAYLAGRLSVPRRCVSVESGVSGRSKRVDIAADGLAAAVIAACLLDNDSRS